jgi:hypothetical protein
LLFLISSVSLESDHLFLQASGPPSGSAARAKCKMGWRAKHELSGIKLRIANGGFLDFERKGGGL